MKTREELPVAVDHSATMYENKYWYLSLTDAMIVYDAIVAGGAHVGSAQVELPMIGKLPDGRDAWVVVAHYTCKLRPFYDQIKVKETSDEGERLV